MRCWLAASKMIAVQRDDDTKNRTVNAECVAKRRAVRCSNSAC